MLDPLATSFSRSGIKAMISQGIFHSPKWSYRHLSACTMKNSLNEWPYTIHKSRKGRKMGRRKDLTSSAPSFPAVSACRGLLSQSQ